MGHLAPSGIRLAGGSQGASQLQFRCRAPSQELHQTWALFLNFVVVESVARRERRDPE
ncbi:hypothetical protein FOA52_015857 [Chlamydomonas sp. UWO 241]|nr:hypothetical protein FOA52_015857 [Chlamydomonas sp. UWO 241]